MILVIPSNNKIQHIRWIQLLKRSSPSMYLLVIPLLQTILRFTEDLGGVIKNEVHWFSLYYVVQEKK